MAAATHLDDEGLTGRRRVLAWLGACLLIPLSAGFGLTVPLPEVVERVAGSLLSGRQLLAFDEEDAGARPRGVPIVLTPEEAKQAGNGSHGGSAPTPEAAGGTVVVPAPAVPPGWTSRTDDVASARAAHGRTR
jgi:hypothetical protein